MDPRDQTNHMTPKDRRIWALQTALDALVREAQAYEPFGLGEKAAYQWVRQRALEASETLRGK